LNIEPEYDAIVIEGYEGKYLGGDEKGMYKIDEYIYIIFC
jgi:hypothetical protein